ncbi:MAG: hypothetical protein WCB27_02640 [Thermoguttaceae bacterium]
MEKRCSTCKSYDAKTSTCHAVPPNATEATCRLQWFCWQKVKADDWCRAHEPNENKKKVLPQD